MDTQSHPKSIELPDTVEVFGNLKNAKRFAIDIGKLPKHFVNIIISTALFSIDGIKNNKNQIILQPCAVIHQK
jgi:hypothetical protein